MTDAPVRFELVDINAILKTLPHRYPMLLIDRLINVRSDHSGIGIKNVTYNEPVFLGHFPDRPVYPGVLMIEAMAQTAGVIGIKAMETDKPRAVYFLTIDSARFRKPVVPGSLLSMPVRKVRQRGPVWKFEGQAFVGDELCAEAQFSAMIHDGSNGWPGRTVKLWAARGRIPKIAGRSLVIIVVETAVAGRAKISVSAAHGDFLADRILLWGAQGQSSTNSVHRTASEIGRFARPA